MRVNGAWLRRLAYAGARYGPRPFVRSAPVAIGTLFACLLHRQRRHVRRNLQRVCGERAAPLEHLRVARTFVAFAHCLTEGLAPDRPGARDARVDVDGEERLGAELARGGAIIVTAHTGAWDVAARMLRQRFRTDVMLAMAAEPSPGARQFHDSLRARSGVRVVRVGQDALDVLPIVRHLKKGGILAVQLDRPGSGPTIDVELFGGPAKVPSGPFAVARITRVPVVPVFCRRVGHLAYAIETRPAIRLDRGADDRDLAAAAQQAARDMEDFICRHPTQWFDFGS